VSALAGTISAPFAPGRAGFDAMRLLRIVASLALAVGVLAIALPVAFGSGMQGAGSDPLRVFSSGPAVVVDASGVASLSVENLVPGESRAATIRVSNAGSAASLSLVANTVDRVGAGGTPLSSLLRLRIVSPAGSVLYAGSLAGLPRLRLGQIAAGGSRAFSLTVTLPRNAGNEVAGGALSAAFAWSASN
jgi:hypothetical protein